jgi:transcriptional regulator CtsR
MTENHIPALLKTPEETPIHLRRSRFADDFEQFFEQITVIT